MTVRVMLADDQELIRRGFRMILEEQPDITVVGEAADGDQAVRLTRQLSPDVVVMDVRMPGLTNQAVVFAYQVGLATPRRPGHT